MREGWKYERLGDIATYINGFAFKPDDWGSEGLPIIRIQNLTDTQKEFNYCSRNDIPSKYYIENGDILISWSATLGVFEWSKGLALLNQHIFKVVFDKVKINKPYFKYVILTSIEEMSRHTNGATMKHIRKGDFDNIKVPVPPLSEQERIVSLLDLEFAKIDVIKANAEKQLQDAKDLFQSALKDLLTPKEGWKEKNIVDICSDIFAGGDAPKDRKKEKEKDYKYPIYSNGIEQKGLYGFTNTYRVNKPSITIAARGTIGVAFIRMEPFTPIVRLVTLIPDLNVVDINFLCYLIQGHDWSNTGAAIPQLTIPMVKDVNLYLPTLVNQQLIAEKLDLLSEKVKQLQSSYEKTITLCNDLKQSILKDIFG